MLLLVLGRTVDVDSGVVKVMQEFFTNVSRYPRYLISFSLGVLYTLISPLLPMFKRPTTAIATSVLILSGLAFIAFTLRAMLGLNPV